MQFEVEVQASSDARLAVARKLYSSMKITPSLRDRDRKSLRGGGEILGLTQRSWGTKRDLWEGRYAGFGSREDLGDGAPTRDLEDDRERIEGSMRK